MKYDKLKQLVGNSVAISPHPTMGMKVVEPVSAKSVPVKAVSAKSVPINTVPTKPVPTNSVPTNYVPTNYVPTFKSTDYQSFTNDIKTLITSIEVDNSIDEVVFKSLSKVDKLVYLATRGWRLSIEMRGNKAYDYAVKYINRKKFRIYLGKTEI